MELAEVLLEREEEIADLLVCFPFSRDEKKAENARLLASCGVEIPASPIDERFELDGELRFELAKETELRERAERERDDLEPDPGPH